MLQEKTANEFVFFGEPFCAVTEVEAKATGQDLAKIVFFGSGDTTAEADFSRCFIAGFEHKKKNRC